MITTLFKTAISKAPLNAIPRRMFAASKGFNYQLLQLEEVRAGLRETAEKFSQEEIAPLAEITDKKDVFPAHLWKKMGEIRGKEPPKFMSTHPPRGERVQDLTAYSEKVLPLYQQTKR